jgi:4'-phosphopantetheinyl transferase EntD
MPRMAPPVQEVVASLVPASVIVRGVAIADVEGELTVAEEHHVRRAVARRRREFLAGRVCAREALAMFGVSVWELLPDRDRVPKWPCDLVGSITHGAGQCAVAIASRRHLDAVGIDLEETGRLQAPMLRLVCTPAERAQLEAWTPGDPMLGATLVFSIKEAFYKCQFPMTRTRLDFQDIEVESPAQGQCVVRLLRSASWLRAGEAIPGRYAMRHGWVTTAVTVPAGRWRSRRDCHD